MATTSKVSFRARALDSNKPMGVYYTRELPELSECAPIARSVMQMPTGMEKDEEMELHLQEVIVAQQASTSGGKGDNPVIPTPKVYPIKEERYNCVYPAQSPLKNDQYIKVQAWVSLDQEEPDYDYDSEDEKWLKERPHIDERSFEKVFDAFEAQSTGHICTPEDIKGLLPQHTEDFVGEIYDYWIQKRTHAAKNVKNFATGVGGLIPRIRTDCRKDSTGINPYVAFRRRAEKMQTRKHRKNDEDSYEKVLKVTFDLSKAHLLVDMIRRREKTKAALIDFDSEIFAKRMQLEDFGNSIYGQVMSKMRQNEKIPATPTNGSRADSDGGAKKKKKSGKPRGVRPATLDREIPTPAWMKEMNKVWNKPPAMGGVSAVTEVDRHVQATQDAHQDGRYTFKRRRGCIYRAPILPTREGVSDSHHVHKEATRPELRFVPIELPDVNGDYRPAIPVRRRIGRGGRIIYDRINNEESRVPKNGFDPFEENFIVETLPKPYRSKPVPWASLLRYEKYFPYNDEERERKWLTSAEEDLKEETPPKNDQKNSDENSGNGQPGRVTALDDRSKEVPAEEWREASGSPTESNSSTEWTPPSLGARAAAFALLPGVEDAKTGDFHPQAGKIKESIMGVATLMDCTTAYILPPAPIGTL